MCPEIWHFHSWSVDLLACPRPSPVTATTPPPALWPACLHSVRLMSCSIINRFSVLRRFVCIALVYRPSPSPDRADFDYDGTRWQGLWRVFFFPLLCFALRFILFITAFILACAFILCFVLSFTFNSFRFSCCTFWLMTTLIADIKWQANGPCPQIPYPLSPPLPFFFFCLPCPVTLLPFCGFILVYLISTRCSLYRSIVSQSLSHICLRCFLLHWIAHTLAHVHTHAYCGNLFAVSLHKQS